MAAYLSLPTFPSLPSSVPLPLPFRHRPFPILSASSGYNVQIAVEEDEPEEVLLRRFRREVSKAGIIQEFRRRAHFENKQEEKKRRKQDAARRNKFRRSGFRFTPRTPTSADGDTPKTAREDADDNWDLPEGDLPY